jgi:UDP-N-acetylglucosamine diphosphorylase/glucosamine-1-phosphate N-acetyltransferase
MNYILTDLHNREHFLPFTHTRSIADIRVGILTIAEKWAIYLHSTPQINTADFLQAKYGAPKYTAQNYFINASVLPNEFLLNEINTMASGSVLYFADTFVACCLSQADAENFSNATIEKCNRINAQFETIILNKVTDIFSLNDAALRADFDLITLEKGSAKIDKTNTLINDKDIFIEEGAKVTASILNASTGPIYIGKNAEVMDGCIIRGPFALCEGAQLKMGAKIYGATTLGPGCKVGGEVNNSVFFANSSKAHDGFIGNSVIGEWCNLGADTNNSNLKNNYEEVKLWSEVSNKFEKTGLQFCGLMMGDHSKCGINTMFNTGTVVGVSCNIFGAGFPRNFIPSFSWGGAAGFTEYKIDKALQTMQLVFARRNKTVSEQEIALYHYIYQHTQNQRNY